jgi:hypothetical protein
VKRLVVILYAVPVLLSIAASLLLMEPILVLLCCLLLCGLAVVIASSLLGFARSRNERLWPVLGGGIICLALVGSVAIFHWPLRAAWLLSRPPLDRLAVDVRAGRPLPRPGRFGLFRIVAADVNRQGIVSLWVDPDPGGRMGFVQCPPGDEPGSLWSMLRMDGRWAFVKED